MADRVVAGDLGWVLPGDRRLTHRRPLSGVCFGPSGTMSSYQNRPYPNFRPVPRPSSRMVVPPGEKGQASIPIRADHPFDLSVRERVARAVATLVYYHKDGGSWAAASLLHGEAQPLQRWLSSVHDDGLKARVLALIEADLRERYD